MKKLFLIIIVFLSLPIFAQSDLDTKALFIEAEYHYLYEEFDEALEIYIQIYKNDSNNSNLNYRIGQSILHLVNNKKYKRNEAIYFLEKSIESLTMEYNEGYYKERNAPYEALFYLGNAYRFNHEFDKAIISYERFISYLPPTDYYYIDYVKRESQACHNAKELTSVPVNFETEELADLVESNAKLDNFPVVNFDEDVMVYTSGVNNSFSPDISMAAMSSDYKIEEIYYKRFVDTAWTDAVCINKQIKAGKSTVPTAMPGDGLTLYTVRDDNDNGNIYVSHFKNNKWSRMKKLGKKINSPDWESHVSITRDGKTLFFTSDRPGGYGGLDVYKSNFDEASDEWGEAENLGPTINSIYDEETPYIINDGKILYFSSQGHYGMGGFDIFYSSLLDNGKWTSPMNMGYPLNTVGNDLFYLPKRDNAYAIFPLNSSDRPEEFQNELFKIEIPEPGDESTQIDLRGLVTVEDNNWPLYYGAQVMVINNDNYDTLNIKEVNLETGSYNCIIPAGNFKVIFFAPGYESRIEYVQIPKIFAKTEFVLNVDLKPLSVSDGHFYVIKNVFFEFGKHDLTKKSQTEIERLYDIMLENPGLYIEVVGYTDSRSSVDFNQKLSERRAKSVINYLIDKKISSQRFVAIGRGESNPIAINLNPDGTDNPDGRQLNRRVEVKLMNYNGDRIIVEQIKVPSQLRYNNQASSILLLASDKVLESDYFDKKFEKSRFDAKLVKHKSEYKNTLYYFTDYDSKASALKDLNDLIDYGFEGAQIVQEIMPDPVKSLLDIEKSTGEYTVQIKALSIKVDAKEFTDLENVKIHHGKDGFYRYTIGMYDTREAVERAKEEITKNELLKDAFIVSIKNLKKY